MTQRPTQVDGAKRDERPETDAVSARDDKQSLRHLSHDIRAAMSDVIGGLRLVESHRLDPQTQTQIDRVQSAADTLAALVDHALLEAAGESPISHDPTPLVLEDWLHGMSHRWRGQAAEQNRAFRIRREGPVPAQWRVSWVSLTRLVGNLVSNALRHATTGKVELCVDGTPDGGLCLRVKDNGPGFPSEVLDGRRPERPAATAGSGLGLSIARSLSEDLGIDMTLENTAEGACAVLVLGPELVDHGPASPGPAAPVSLSGLQVLVAEDNLTNQTILRHMFKALGTEADFVGDGRAAFNALTTRRYDIALLDIEMPEMSGLEVMEAIRAMEGEVATMPLVAITAYVLRDNREAIYAAGADGIISKPVPSADELGRAILRHVGNATPRPVPSPSDFGEGRLLDHNSMDRLLEAAGPQGREELLRHLRDDLLLTLKTMERAIAEEDDVETRAQTHILIAISGAVGADRLSRNAEALNIAAKRRSTDRFEVLFPAIRADIEALIADVARRGAEGDVVA